MIVGTSYLLDQPIDSDEDRALHYLKQASKQRATPSDRAQAVLLQLDLMADSKRYRAAQEAIESFLRGFDPVEAQNTSEGNYHLTVASCWQRPTDGMIPTNDMRQVC